MEHLNKRELLALLRAARSYRERDWLMILVAFWHGLRATEVVGIRKDHIVDGMLDVKRLKGSNATIQPLVEHSNPLLNERDALLAYSSFLREKQRLFPVTRQTFWAIMQRAGETAGIPVRLRHPHILKHTIAKQTIENAGIENVRVYLGHKTMASTGEYLKKSDAEASTAVQKSASGLLSLL